MNNSTEKCNSSVLNRLMLLLHVFKTKLISNNLFVCVCSASYSINHVCGSGPVRDTYL